MPRPGDRDIATLKSAAMIPAQLRPSSGLNTVAAALLDLRSGRPVIVVDDEDREIEGDLIMAAQHATPQALAFYLRHTSGLICAPMTPEIADRLQLPPMVQVNEDPAGTAYTVSVDAAAGIESGIRGRPRTPCACSPPSPPGTASRGPPPTGPRSRARAPRAGPRTWLRADWARSRDEPVGR
ncbi:3,4-dihydroxy-2-butanone-4-phosphate synthase [Amycolatopsis carbonis]|uniref:3,4-dihydroxy-2-butanone-4-phosphate synthase n=1 Tax=Amycolatopsis carbonis TaxID=715471 RepID=A0A9Y2III1_9PSEU|nr:3,4-dihydroxy-2-butanone-4-phosphate synthase [Amycolatopsis sp. 2-15]WIX80960.1 3,4-dihydroxy-2-butanone-4-phosphate synthase [Amycolatopsis sp. 2-15]